MINVFLDIETAPTTDAALIAEIEAGVTAPAQYKKPESIEAWMAENGAKAKAEAVGRTALDGTFGELLCIGYAVEDRRARVVWRGAHREGTLLRRFARQLMADLNEQGLTGTVRWVGHNVTDFDLPFLFKRSVVCGVATPFLVADGDFRRISYDTMRAWAGWKGYVKQTDLERALGIAREDEIDGSQVATARPEQVIRHCRQDVQNVRKIYKRLQGGVNRYAIQQEDAA